MATKTATPLALAIPQSRDLANGASQLVCRKGEV